ncbi:DUF5615 family PIN-like protein [Egicoccus sp. AB-alg2]|uniref:DUF5615 family PIN-like protein n=1 Tax=Egicoccus sp. AB-alg2 TaxID=3242693 RepID=UPI00359CD5ED
MRFLVDEMFPPATAQVLRRDSDQEAEHVTEVGLAGADDADVASFSRAHGAAVVTDNVADFARMDDLVVVFVLKRRLPAGNAQAAAIASLLRRWAADHPRPYVGYHWPT